MTNFPARQFQRKRLRLEGVFFEALRNKAGRNAIGMLSVDDMQRVWREACIAVESELWIGEGRKWASGMR